MNASGDDVRVVAVNLGAPEGPPDRDFLPRARRQVDAGDLDCQDAVLSVSDPIPWKRFRCRLEAAIRSNIRHKTGGLDCGLVQQIAQVVARPVRDGIEDRLGSDSFLRPRWQCRDGRRGLWSADRLIRTGYMVEERGSVLANACRGWNWCGTFDCLERRDTQLRWLIAFLIVMPMVMMMAA